jgi:hypothetical protein
MAVYEQLATRGAPIEAKRLYLGTGVAVLLLYTPEDQREILNAGSTAFVDFLEHCREHAMLSEWWEQLRKMTFLYVHLAHEREDDDFIKVRSLLSLLYAQLQPGFDSKEG